MDLLSLAMQALGLRSIEYRRDQLSSSPPGLLQETPGLHFVESGAALIEGNGARVELAAGDIALVARPVARVLQASSSRDDETCVLSGAFEFASPDHPLLPALPSVFHVTRKRLSSNRQWPAYLESLRDEVAAPREGSRALIVRISEIVIIHAMRLSPPPARSECPNSGWLRGLHDPLLQPVLAAMHAQPGRSWTLARLAKLAGQSRSAFAAHFAESMGEPPMTYLNRWRMFRARCLLRESKLPIAAIAEEVGYGSGAAFSLAFTREHRTSPGAYRSAVRGGDPERPLAYTPA
jgi:AraC-like DNA-binding protein